MKTSSNPIYFDTNFDFSLIQILKWSIKIWHEKDVKYTKIKPEVFKIESSCQSK